MQSTINVQSVISAIRKAQDSWKGWDWQQYVGVCRCGALTGSKRDRPIIGDTDYLDAWHHRLDDLIYEEGHTHECANDILAAERGYARIVARDAARAAELGNLAIAALLRGALADAAQDLEKAMSIEDDHGEAVSYGPAMTLLGALIEIENVAA